ncbi:polysaccharide deacetylase family protein [Peribacillus cavernae]|uniref:Polysaccharide deacetylase family protein n=2 Tax=Peribacillus cavernae TaxID=1674310 RepID=A0A3S0TYV7_9BACI|nr:polysaccharide deacetylase family protein [Peribacillus cavernae]
MVTALFSLFLAGCGGELVTPKDESKGEQEEATETKTETKKTEEKIKERSEVHNQAESKTEASETEPAVKNSTPQYRLNPANWSFKPISNANPKVVLLTFDDAPDKHALQIAKTLKEHGVKAIFFVNGHFLESEAEKAVLKQIYDMGFPIGNHTYSHAALKDLTEKEQYNEIVKLNDMVESITGERPKFFRAPFGMNTEFSKKLVAQEKMLLMNWTYGYDWENEYQNKEALTKIMLNSPYLSNGANLLMHDRAWTSAALSDIITGLQDKGFKMLDPFLIETP